jgi:hypothetical protein
MKAIPITMPKILEIHLTKGGGKLYNKNYKTLMKEIEDHTKTE